MYDKVKIKVFSILVILLFVGSVVSELGGVCDGNTLLWHDYNGISRNRDCSVLHSGAGKIFRGECRSYRGGSACYSVNGTVSHEYIIESREKHDVIVNPVTTTTLVAPPIINLQCPACPDCGDYQNDNCRDDMRIDFLAVNKTLESCVKNRDFYRKEYEARIEKSTYDNMVIQKDLENSETKRVLGGCEADLTYSNEWRNYYLYFSVFCCLGICFLIVVWIKKPSWEDPEIDLGKI